MRRPLSRLALTLLLSTSAAWAQGTIRATTVLHDDGTRSTTVFDPDKMTAEESVQTSGGKVLRKVTYILDEQNQPVGSITYDAKGVAQYRTSFKRDEANRISEESVSSPQGVFIRRRVYTYGAQNKVTNVAEFDAEGRVITSRRAKAVQNFQPGLPIRQAQPVRKK